MRNISSKTDNVGDTLPASDFNANLRVELQSIVTDSGFTLDAEGGPDTDLDMLGKSITMYCNASQYYADTGSANTYEVDRVGNLQPLLFYIDGVTVTFKAANSNTGASTIDVDGIGVKDLVDAGGSALTAGAVLAGQYITARYNSSTDDFELVTSSSSSLTTWENIGDDLRPVVSATGTLGDTTHLVEGAYFGDSNIIYLGSGQDLEIYYDGINSYINSTAGELRLQTQGSDRIGFYTVGVERWLINNNGDLRPETNNTYDIGTASYRPASILAVTGEFSSDLDVNGDLTVGNDIFQGDGDVHYFGDSNDGYIYFSGSAFYIDTTYQSISIRSAPGFDVGFGDTSVTRYRCTSTTFRPGTTATYDLGATSYRWDTIYSVNALDTSDIRYKEDIKGSNLGLDFINALSPVSFKLTEVENDRTRHGLIAQEVNEILESIGMSYEDFCGLHYDKETDRWDMDYKHFIAPLINAIKELSRRIDDKADK